MPDSHSPFMNVRQLAEYLHLNEKKVYALASEGDIPATKVTGKWLFPRALVDRWLLDNAHDGLMSDRLVLAGSDDPLLSSASNRLTQQLRTQALFSYTVTGTKLGLDLLAQGSADACVIHWGRAEESGMRHPALLQQYSASKNWVLVHLFQRKQGLIVRPADKGRLSDPKAALDLNTRWAVRQEGAGSQRFLGEWLTKQGYPIGQLSNTQLAFTEREVASMVAKCEVDIGPGTFSAAKEFGLDFIYVCDESFDLVVSRNIYFRKLIRQLFEFLQSSEGLMLAHRLEGYNLKHCGNIIWGAE